MRVIMNLAEHIYCTAHGELWRAARPIGSGTTSA